MQFRFVVLHLVISVHLRCTVFTDYKPCNAFSHLQVASELAITLVFVAITVTSPRGKQVSISQLLHNFIEDSIDFAKNIIGRLCETNASTYGAK